MRFPHQSVEIGSSTNVEGVMKLLFLGLLCAVVVVLILLIIYNDKNTYLQKVSLKIFQIEIELIAAEKRNSSDLSEE